MSLLLLAFGIDGSKDRTDDADGQEACGAVRLRPDAREIYRRPKRVDARGQRGRHRRTKQHGKGSNHQGRGNVAHDKGRNASG